ncbi:TPA: HeH/LEM domain-containing protein [Streptococcus agalactiae]|uniref:HeH/LEM domain-containing protein n=1 Tax=Streptococcus agalactiae TaxID=1311 RepID=UPI0006402F8C|nr:HeH/LEM domain-containing protein [Streptococcus agalactiae]KLK71395.1 hypothetical protein WA87_07695 [Streptococcus agalactiae]HEN2969874.1 hypothetical protein [Streptococcus agalactiae]HEN4382572.1 hypothetical protein [Streptococcus agalactiae]HEO0081869.1 hypothetical protein [Streptococcus agalactiae]HEO1024641.1 hypothetical protein [Streptococcus agalactiae]
MVKVIKAFMDKETGIIYHVGDNYAGDRVDYLTKNGALENHINTHIDFSKLKIDEIKAKLDDLAVQYDSKAKKAELLELLESTVR